MAKGKSGGKRAKGTAVAKSESLTVSYSNFGSDAIMFINRKTLNNGAEIYSSDNTKVTARIEKVNNGYKVTAYRNRGEYDFLGEQSKMFKSLFDARKAVENGFKKWVNYRGD